MSDKKYIQAAPFSSYVLDAITKADGVDSTLFPISDRETQYIAIKEFSSIGNQVGLLLERMLLDEISIREALEQGQNLTEQQMKASNYY
jgi:sorbitol/mannitol transport system substrate-binding protein